MKPLAQNTLIQNRYLIVHLIGKGGMGEVYLAVDQRLGSAVALKRTFFAGDEMLGNAFEREARTLARMRHPVLPKVSDHFGEGDEQYLVMEHISGDDLAKRLEAAGKPFPVSWVLFWADQLLDALSYLHTHEPPIIHRDIKPQNLKLTDENHIILLDFGLSKTSTGQTNISQSGSTGSVVGYTPHYAPMEQIRGIGTSPRSDLYSLSATVYQLLTNKVPVDALSRADSMLNELPDPIVSPSDLNPEVPKVVSDVLLRAMEVSQEKRFANARDMQRVLRKAYNEIHQATTASTVAFSAAEAEAIIAAPTGGAGAGPSIPSVADSNVAGSTAIEPDSSVDLDATMAYDPPASADSGLRQSDVKTEVFLAGDDSLAQFQSEPAPPPDGGASLTNRAADPPAASGDVSGGNSQSFTPAAAVPNISAEHGGFHGNEPPRETGYDAPGQPHHFHDEVPADLPRDEAFAYSPNGDPGFVSETNYAPYSSAVGPQANVVRAQPAKKSRTAVALVGGLAGLVLLGLAVAGGVWAYMNYGPGNAVADPTPSPEETVPPTPAPTPSVELVVNPNVDNSNVNSSSNEDLTVEPTPTPAEEDEPNRPAVTRPTNSRSSGTTPKPAATPGSKRPRPAGTPIRVLP